MMGGKFIIMVNNQKQISFEDILTCVKKCLNSSLLRTKNSMSRGLFYSFLYISFNFLSESQCYLFWDVPKGSHIPSHPFSSKVNSLNLGNFSSLFPCCPNSSKRDCKWIYKHFLQLELISTFSV